jgi:hypothetical protein
MVDVTPDAAVEEAEAEDSPTQAPPAANEMAQQITDAIAALRPEMAEPEDDELDEEIVFVRNGWIRVTIAGQLHKLRRPFLGELRDLDLSREADQEVLNEKNKELRDKTDLLLVRAREIEDLANEENIDPQRKTALDVEATQLALRANTESRALVREAHAIRAAWWEQVFKVLTPPSYEVPEQMPAWIGDVSLQVRAIEHWQTVPLGRGDKRGM